MDYPKHSPRITWMFKFFNEAAEAAKNSLCQKTPRGAVLVLDDEIIGRGCNGAKEACHVCLRANIHTNTHRELCLGLCAEQRAIIDAFKQGHQDLSGAILFYAKTENGKIRPSGPPTCAECARYVRELGIRFAMMHANKVSIYAPEQFYVRTFEALTGCVLAVIH